MQRIPAIFDRLRSANRRGLMPFVTGGFPDLEATRRVLPAMAAAGADVIEIGIPFSDPIADGPVIAESMARTLASGVTPAALLNAVGEVRSEVDAGLLAMVSVSIVDRIGQAPFVRACAEAGIDGLIVPDLDLDEAPGLRAVCDAAGLTLTLLVAPTSSAERVARITSLCSGFVYVLARTGITGERGGSVPTDLSARVELVRSTCDLPVAVGFGISTADQVRAVTEIADAAIVGSTIVRTMTDATDPVAAAVAQVAALGAARAGATSD